MWKKKKDVVSRLKSKVGISINLRDSSDSEFQSWANLTQKSPFNFIEKKYTQKKTTSGCTY